MFREEIFFLAFTLEPERKLMASLAHLTSADWELQQMHQMLERGTRTFRFCELHEGTLFTKFFAETLTQFRDPRLWSHHAQVEQFRSTLLQLSFRACALVFQTVLQKVKGYPYKLFHMLTLDHEQKLVFANDLLFNTATCMYDSGTRSFVKMFPTVDAATSSQATKVLELMARKALGTTFSTERLHSQNLRRVMARSCTHRPDVGHLGLSHFGCSKPVWLVEIAVPEVTKNKRGRPPKQVADQPDDNVPKPKQRRGGGAWRAYLTINAKGQKLNATLLNLLSVQYQGLDQEAKERYKRLGHAGLHLSFFLQHTVRRVTLVVVEP